MHPGYDIPDSDNPPYAPPLLPLDPAHFHHFAAGGSFFPAANFKLGAGGDANVRHGNDRFRQPSLPHWQDQRDSPIKQPPPFWEHLTIPEESNENSLPNDKRSPQHFVGELEAIYKPLVSTAAGTNEHTEEEKVEAPIEKRKKRKKRNIRHMMGEFFGSLVKQVVDHQENMHKRFAEAMERLEEERKAREEEWRRREAERLEQESEEREREKASAKGREAMIVSYLERITGERIDS